MMKILVIITAFILTACSTPKLPGCREMSCRPVSKPDSLTIWWQPDLRNGPYDYTSVSVNQ
ncbi:hypothetical protein C7420_102543 [Pantoea ananatis]|jgi:hypothetical protein|nr:MULTISPECIES: HrpT family type III secretion system protein [Pantoea]RAR73500.1 hypothetical protein C7420_102543 [Pantoea ananatis]REF10084.1 hypothetical protein C7428_2385 [Pantoea ananatis]